jgi:hypothetical protein
MACAGGLPVVFAARRVLEGVVLTTGVCGLKVDEALWNGVVKGLESRALGIKECVKSGSS